MKEQAIAERVAIASARATFRTRGNHSEAHLSEADLAGIIQSAIMLALRMATDASIIITQEA